MNKKILLLREQIEWMGDHSGYDLLFENLLQEYPSKFKQIRISRKRHLKSKILDIFISPFFPKINYNTSYKYDRFLAIAELKLLWNQLFNKYDLLHITFIERNFGLLQKLEKKLNIIGTVHQPPGWWKMIHRKPEIVSSFKSLIVLSTEQLKFFDEYLPERTYFIPLGVDTKFFKPANNINARDKLNNPRFVFCGTWLRDFNTLTMIIDELITKNPYFKFDLVIPPHTIHHGDPNLHRIARHSQVKWHSKLTDNELLKVYQEACVLILPIIDATSNHTLLEAIACGLPVVTNNVGGIPDYTNKTFATLLPVGEVEIFVDSISKIIENQSEYEKKSLAARSFAKKNFSMDNILSQTLKVYEKIISL